MQKKQIIDSTVKSFEKLTKWRMKVKQRSNAQNELDAEVFFNHPETKTTIHLSTKIKNELRSNDLAKLFILKDLHKNFLLIAQYISKSNLEILRKHQINYMDSSGNCFINQAPIFIFIENQKTQEQRQTSRSKIYTESGMRFIYAALLNPSMVANTYRKIAYEEAEIALGNVGAIIEDLEKQGFITIKNGVRILKNKSDLFNLWANNYGITQRPHLLQSRMSFTDKNDLLNWKRIKLTNAYWGGEPAAHLLDHFLVPEQFVIYSPMTELQLMKQYKLVPDHKGNVLYMLPPFERKELPEKADPFVIYAELIESKDSRCIEAAQRIKEKYIDPKL